MGTNEVDHRTCGDCQHWRRLPSNPGELGAVRGECRESPPAGTAIIAAAGGGFKHVGWIAGYPPIAPDFPACSHFQQKEAKHGTQNPVSEG
jgi:hypothetical protein